jgi:periplasmic mercuric ion binding protein
MRKILIIFAALLTQMANAQKVQSQNDTILIHTSAVCETCKETIEHDLSFVKGIVSSNLSVETRDLTVIFDSNKIDANKIRTEVTKIGYDADSLKADPKAFKKLPECCKKPHNE